MPFTMFGESNPPPVLACGADDGAFAGSGAGAGAGSGTRPGGGRQFSVAIVNCCIALVCTPKIPIESASVSAVKDAVAKGQSDVAALSLTGKRAELDRPTTPGTLG